MAEVDFAEIERQLEVVLDKLGGELSSSERQEVVELIDAGEYGIALETLSSLLVEESKQVPASAFAQMVELAEAMGIRASAITDELTSRVLAE